MKGKRVSKKPERKRPRNAKPLKRPAEVDEYIPDAVEFERDGMGIAPKE